MKRCVPQTIQGLAALRCPPNDETVHFLVEGFDRCLGRYSKAELVAAADAWRRLLPRVPGKPLFNLLAEMDRRAKFAA